MGDATFHPFRGYAPDVVADLRASHPAHFLATLSGKGEHPHEVAIGPAKALSGPPHECELAVGQNPVPGRLGRRRLHADAGRGLYDRPINEPAEEGLKGSKRAIRADR